ncbi:MAG: nucleotide disphospho-sugar-binding domain-containing protein [Aliidongia sp.]
MRPRIEASGAVFHAFPQAADLDLKNIETVFPELLTIPPGPEMSLFYLTRAFIDPLAAQYEGIKRVLWKFPADVILNDNMFYGAMPMLLGPRSARPAIISCGTMFLHFGRDDGAPNFAGLPPATSDDQCRDYAAIAQLHDEIVYAPARRHINTCLTGLGVGPLSMDPHEAVIALSDAYLQLTVPSFEFPRQALPDHIHFVGTLPITPNQAPMPSWASDLDGSKKVVLVTQGTVSNHDFGKLVAPTLAALAHEPDLLVVVTTGGRPVGAIPGPIPANARLATFLPFEWLMPQVDLLVTNGGYGSVNQALSFGIPLVTAGLTEDKADVNARVTWSGVGINLMTNEPGPEDLRQAVRAVFENPAYRDRACAMAQEFASIDTRAEILRIIGQCARSLR